MHYEITSLDLVKTEEIMRKTYQGPGQLLENALSKIQDELTADRESKIAKHEHAAAEFIKNMNLAHSTSSSKLYAATISSTVFTKKNTFEANAISDLKPIGIKHLRLDITHYGYFLRAKVVGTTFVIKGTCTLIEDEYGDVTTLAIYNMFSPDLEGLHSAQTVLKKGVSIVIVEPYYKIFISGGVGIRVDDAKDLKIISDTPSDPIGWQKEGKAYISKKIYKEAVNCFESGLKLVFDSYLVMAICNSLGTCFMKQGNEPISLLYYTVSAYVGEIFNEKDSHLLLFKAYAKAALLFNQRASSVATEYLIQKLIKLDIERFRKESELTVFRLSKESSLEPLHQRGFVVEAVHSFIAYLQAYASQESTLATEGKTAIDLKNEGNTNLINDKIAQAISCYLSSLRLTNPLAASLLLDKASAGMLLGEYHDVILSCIVSVILSNQAPSAAALTSLCQALQSYAMMSECLQVTELTLSLHPDDITIQEFYVGLSR
jgi:tetratricopeptide (TPR) repeat protein